MNLEGQPARAGNLAGQAIMNEKTPRLQQVFLKR
jgi:hypothetical protein